MQKYGNGYHVLWVSCDDSEETTKIDERPFPSPTPSLASATSGTTSPREGRLLLSIVVLEFLGTGLVLPSTSSISTRSAASRSPTQACCWGRRPWSAFCLWGPAAP